jgi:hypothetical protein
VTVESAPRRRRPAALANLRRARGDRAGGDPGPPCPTPPLGRTQRHPTTALGAPVIGPRTCELGVMPRLRPGCAAHGGENPRRASDDRLLSAAPRGRGSSRRRLEVVSTGRPGPGQDEPLTGEVDGCCRCGRRSGHDRRRRGDSAMSHIRLHCGDSSSEGCTGFVRSRYAALVVATFLPRVIGPWFRSRGRADLSTIRQSR